jgi:hypothetical protein
MVTPLSQEIRHGLGSNCGSTVSALRDLIKGPIQEILRTASLEASASQAADNTANGHDQVSGVFQEIAAATAATVDGIFGNPLTEVPNAVQELVGSVTGDIAGVVSGTLSGLITPGNLEDDCGSQIGTAIVTAAFSGIASQLQGEIAQAQVLTGQVSSVFSALRSSDTGGPASFGLGLLHSTLTAFKSTLSNELFILGQLPPLITAINKNILKFTDSDYSTDHLLLVAICQQLLMDANNNLGSVLIGMQDGGRLNQISFDIARSDIELAKELLSGFEISDIFGKLTSPLTLQIAAQITLLIAYTQALEKLSAINRGKVDRIGEFMLQYKLFQPNVDFLYAPTIQLIRCRLSKIILDMGATAQLNQIFAFVVREKKWLIQLSVVLALLDGCKLLNKANANLEKIKLDWQFRVSAVADSYPADLPPLVPELYIYIALVKQKLSFNISAASVVNKGNDVINLINAYRTDATAMAGRRLAEDVFGGILPEGIVNNIALTEIANPLIDAMGALESAAGPGIALAQSYMLYLDKNGMSGFADALKEGDISKFFSLDAFTSVLFGQAGEYVNAAFNCYEDQGDPVAMQVLRRNGALYQERRRSDDLFRLATEGSSREYTDVTLNTEIPAIQETVISLDYL